MRTNRRGFLGLLSLSPAVSPILAASKPPLAQVPSIPAVAGRIALHTTNTRNIVYGAFRFVGLLARDGELSAEDLDYGLRRLNSLQNDWALQQYLPSAKETVIALADDLAPAYAITYGTGYFGEDCTPTHWERFTERLSSQRRIR